ncbi:response regulator [Singulisphaera acidiphila]|uniref:Response regulator with CheY-like receiver, AAA-type ATPase, and DNA-binding domains n=1 Tax=Singulisphaera acidiphila (strain ATCC BAA-1392 / DSM 18658 / VKM B-2454 / MOB10) TaxID=886293 RepID=L0DA20_SINAD|nr:response regulator [Singulisphaera acidiphila]AGA26092.1 response regulator with CheY-like receiver, AAA-type ATPase, and DNA-binding domains [Singulisphaera acidiphila DSM 18658]
MPSAAPILTTTFRVGGAKPYVLLVDDHAPSLRQLHQVVKGAGHSCMVASSGAQAVSHCDLQRPQVIVTDLSMPNLDGRGLAHWIRARYPSVPLILMTGEILDPPTLASIRRTFTAVFRKPIDLERFLNCLDRLMPSERLLEPTLTYLPD